MRSRSGIANLCGIAAPLLWGAAIVVCGSLRPDYSHVNQYISELGERGSSTELLMRWGGFVPTGLMHAAFAAFLYHAFKGNRLAAIAAALLAVNGIARVGAGLFPCAPGCGGARLLLSEKLHSLSAAVGFFAFIGTAITWGVVIRRMPGRRLLSASSFVAGGLGLVFLMLMSWSAEARTATGLYERLSSGALSLWVLVLAVQMRQREPRPGVS